MATIGKKSGRRVRLRGQDYPLEGTLVVERDGQPTELRFRLLPNQWTIVPDEVHTMLKNKFSNAREWQVPDADENEDRPHDKGEAAATYTERRLEYIIEGL